MESADPPVQPSTGTARGRHYGALRVTIHPSNEALGAAAADEVAEIMQEKLEATDRTSVILATGNSQLSFIDSLRTRPDIDWAKINVFHMDEYLGMQEDHPASFRRWMHEKLVDHVGPREFHGIRGDASDTADELNRYAGLLGREQPALCVMGIGENGHLAFNDPPADFQAPEPLRIVTLDEVSRRQQVGEGHFPSLEQTPAQAITLTIPTLLAPERVLVLVPERRKAEAVRGALEGPVTPDCPASILRHQAHAHLHLDEESAALLA